MKVTSTLKEEFHSFISIWESVVNLLSNQLTLQRPFERSAPSLKTLAYNLHYKTDLNISWQLLLVVTEETLE